MFLKINQGINKIHAVTGFGITLIIWIILSGILGEIRLPPPWIIVLKFITHAISSPEIALQGAGQNGFIPHVLTTLLRYIIGFVSGILLSYLCLILIARLRWLKDLFTPIVNIFRAIPPLALAPFMLLWFGTNATGIIAIVTFYAFTMIFVAGVEAIEKLDPAKIDFSRTLGANKTTIVFNVVLPSILPAMVGPIKVAASWSWGLVVIGELLGAKSGIGRILNAFIPMLSTDLIMVGIIWVLLLAIGMELIVNLILNHLLRWTPGMRR